MSTAKERFDRRLKRKKVGTRRNYTDAFDKFLGWAKLDTEELYRLQYEAELGTMNGDVEPWKANEVSNLVSDYMAKMTSEGYAAGHVKQIYYAVRLFMKASGLKNFEVDREDKPRSYSAGQAAATLKQISGMIDACHGNFKLRNQALILFLKDTGFRVSDATPRMVEEYLEGKGKSPVPGFAVFEPVETEKEGIFAYPHIGSETVEALDLYLNGRSTGPLFLGIMKGGQRGANVGLGHMKPDSITVQIMRLSEHLPNNGKRISAHSLRKFHRTRLEGAGMPEGWVKKLQGKKVDTYNRPEEDMSEIYPGESKLTERYIECYDELRVHGLKDKESVNLRSRIQELEEELTRSKMDFSELDVQVKNVLPRLQAQLNELSKWMNTVNEEDDKLDQERERLKRNKVDERMKKLGEDQMRKAMAKVEK